MRWCYCTDDTWLINIPPLRNLGGLCFTGRLSRALEGKSCMYSTNTGNFSSIFYNWKISSLAACIGKIKWWQKAPKTSRKDGDTICAHTKGHLPLYQWINSAYDTQANLPSEACHWGHKISDRFVLSGLFSFPVSGCVAVIPKAGYCKGRTGYVVSV